MELKIGRKDSQETARFNSVEEPKEVITSPSKPPDKNHERQISFSPYFENKFFVQNDLDSRKTSLSPAKLRQTKKPQLNLTGSKTTRQNFPALGVLYNYQSKNRSILKQNRSGSLQRYVSSRKMLYTYTPRKLQKSPLRRKLLVTSDLKPKRN